MVDFKCEPSSNQKTTVQLHPSLFFVYFFISLEPFHSTAFLFFSFRDPVTLCSARQQRGGFGSHMCGVNHFYRSSSTTSAPPGRSRLHLNRWWEASSLRVCFSAAVGDSSAAALTYVLLCARVRACVGLQREVLREAHSAASLRARVSPPSCVRAVCCAAEQMALD